MLLYGYFCYLNRLPFVYSWTTSPSGHLSLQTFFIDNGKLNDTVTTITCDVKSFMVIYDDSKLMLDDGITTWATSTKYQLMIFNILASHHTKSVQLTKVDRNQFSRQQINTIIQIGEGQQMYLQLKVNYKQYSITTWARYQQFCVQK